MREFKNAKELLALCSEKDLPISEIMRQREIIIGEMQEQEVNARMTHVLEIMKEAAFSPIKHPVKSMGGLIGGESKKLFLHQASGKGICGELLEKSHHLCYGNSGNQCFHGANRGLSDCGFCRNRSRPFTCPSGSLSTTLTNISKSTF